LKKNFLLSIEGNNIAPRCLDNMLHVVFLGMDLRILDALRQCPIHLCGVYLPPAPYQYLNRPPWFLKYIPRFLFRKRFKTAAVYAGVNQYLHHNHVAALQAKQVNSRRFRNQVAKCKVDLGVVANFGQMIDGRLLSIPRYGFINCHPSLLPKYRGPSPLGHILLNEEKVSGVTWHRVSTRIDQGGILAQAQFEIDQRDTEADLDQKTTALAIRLLQPLLADIAAERAHVAPQDESQATYYPKLTVLEKKQLSAQGKRPE
jgi:methionyl-tRNA formyltransferase